MTEWHCDGVHDAVEHTSICIDISSGLFSRHHVLTMHHAALIYSAMHACSVVKVKGKGGGRVFIPHLGFYPRLSIYPVYM